MMEKGKMYNKHKNLNGHSNGCRYQADDKLLYAKIEIDHKMYLISAEEISLFDQYLEKAKNKDKDVNIDLFQSDNLPFQIVYGGMMYNEGFTLERIFELAEEMRGYAFLDLEEDKVNVSGYQNIVFYPEEAESENYIPFAALIQMPHRLENMGYSVTLFPYLGGNLILESMMNRPFLLACRESFFIEGDGESWKRNINKEKLMEVYQCADLFIE